MLNGILKNRILKNKKQVVKLGVFSFGDEINISNYQNYLEQLNSSYSCPFINFFFESNDDIRCSILKYDVRIENLKSYITHEIVSTSYTHEYFYSENNNKKDIETIIKNNNINTSVFFISASEDYFNGVWGQLDSLYQLFSKSSKEIHFVINLNLSSEALKLIHFHNVDNLSLNQFIHFQLASPTIPFQDDLRTCNELYRLFSLLTKFLQIENSSIKLKRFSTRNLLHFENTCLQNMELFHYYCRTIFYKFQIEYE